MMRIKNSPSIKTQWAIAQMRQLASSGENEMKSVFNEADVRDMVAEGKTDKEIADRFGVTEKQVYKYRYYMKIEAAKQTETKQEEPEMIIPTEQIQDTQEEQMGGIRPVIVTHHGEQAAPAESESVQAMTRKEHNTVHGNDSTPTPDMVHKYADTLSRMAAIYATMSPDDDEDIRNGYGLILGSIVAKSLAL